MARTAAGAALTRRHRTEQLALRAATLSDLTALWATVNPSNLSATIDPFARAAAAAVRAGHHDSSALAADYFRLFRDAERVVGAAVAVLAETPALDQVAGALRGAALSGILTSRRAGHSLDSALRNGLVQTTGRGGRLVLDGSRTTILRSTAADRASGRWQRITSGAPCAFCAMLAGRGAVYSANTADFRSHDHCSCEPEPAYPGTLMTEQAQRFADEFERAQHEVSVTGTSNNALNRFRRLYEGRA